ncbi:hypothetical protein Tco_0941403 [Tanacetum coccineum]|uniref:Uncharacterized protein n=1 Tax=Tanacetum coccineum TaxID=301880 RepID=A0ABQ5DSB1_9ASTR
MVPFFLITSVNWHYDHMFTTIKDISRHEDTQLYGAILPNELTNEDIRNSKSYKEYYVIASGTEPPKTKAKVKKKQVNVSKDDDDDNDDDDGNNDDDDDDDADNQDAENQDDDDEQTDSDNNGDDFVHPKFSTHDEEDKEEDIFDPKVQTPSHVESTNDEDSDEEIQDANVEGDKMNEEETNEKAEVDALYRDMNVNLEGRDTEMTDAPRTIVQTTQVIEDTHVIIFSVNPEGQQQSSSVSSGFISVNYIAEPPLLSATTLPPTHSSHHTLAPTLVPTPPTVPSSSLQDLPNFGSLFGFDHRLKALENNFSEFNQTNQYDAAVSSIPGIVDVYLANKMHEAVKTVVQLQSEKLRDEAQAENADFLNKLSSNSHLNESKHLSIAANLSELDLRRFHDKIESNKSIYISYEQRNLYKALVDAYESDKLKLDTYRDTVSFKRHRDDEDKDEEPSARSNQGSKRRRAGKEPESTSALKEKTSKITGSQLKGPNLITSLLK